MNIHTTTRFLFFLLALWTILPLTAQQSKQLYILQTSDTHSRIEPVSPHSSDPYAGLGGVARRAAFVRQARSEHPDLLLVDCGDISQGTPYYNMFGGELEVKAMNLMGYDAMTIGNHEFDNGLDNLARLIRLADFPVVCANYDVTGTVLEGLVQPDVVIERDGLRIGLFGLGAELDGLVQSDKCEGVRFLDPVETARREVKRLREDEQCDVVVCLSHLGISGDESDPISDQALVRGTQGIDLVLGGHSHTYMERPRYLMNAAGKSVPVMHVGKNGTYVGKIILTLTPQD